MYGYAHLAKSQVNVRSYTVRLKSPSHLSCYLPFWRCYLEKL